MDCVISYRLKKSQFGSREWYYELWASIEGKTQCIRGGNTPYKTKRETIPIAEKAVQDYQRFVDRVTAPCVCCKAVVRIREMGKIEERNGEPEYWCKDCVQKFESNRENKE